jgi:hypothetical protein
MGGRSRLSGRTSGRRLNMWKQLQGPLTTLVFAGCTAAFSQSGWPVSVVEAPGQPVRIVGVSLNSNGSLLAGIENRSSKEVRYVELSLSPHGPCPRSDHPLSFVIVYGDRSAFAPARMPGVEPQRSIPAGERVTLDISTSTYRGVIRSQQAAGCPASAKPAVTLIRVAFCDDTGWQGFADGPEHSRWNGKDWTPDTPGNCGVRRSNRRLRPTSAARW